MNQGNYFYGQGRVYLSKRDSDRRVNWRWIGDVSSLNIALTYEQQVGKVSRGGSLLQAQRHITARNGGITATWHDVSADNLAILLYGEQYKYRQNWVSEEQLPVGIVAGNRICLEFQNVRDVVLSGLTEGHDYTVDADWGAIDFLTTPAEQPVIASYDYASYQAVPVLTSTPGEFGLRYESINLAENSRKTLVELYRVNIDPVGMLELINTGNNLVGLETTSLILPDLQKTPSRELGMFGRISMINDFRTITYNDEIDFNGEHNFAY
ncbi:hypothetical protein [Pectobacterium aroidearum]|uniref:phage tail tube protein n=1 Tax=Pectobacterium aroidearum TaxID=1201031 RepID=UPI002115545E|nr:hypothetical protein [Pectobacterium aroidearum]UUE71086.1 hypothetical protein L0Y21_03525 [Pectobacterium aroidearum]UUE71526.1 hypothetical protein L0Y21_05905 [Pectobacterium aroidearum]UUE71594.1 hypothetical protein L0Y21_06285 [Pectobacterium aroidearum]UUE75463.1 hypothetical protein L0Y20_03525 [Pectobacterium aroidearum]UUE75926.1 hypothetical protein L0Y20_06020 [Pectobacterium aroidearum]